jgi:hypothetical protein
MTNIGEGLDRSAAVRDWRLEIPHFLSNISLFDNIIVSADNSSCEVNVNVHRWWTRRYRYPPG